MTPDQCIFTIDVEDWYHILDLPSTPPISTWTSLPSRIESNFERLLDILDENHAQATCFFLGWVAEHYPHLVTMADKRGHEIASHGYAHRLTYEMTADEFLDDITAAKQLLEDIIGREVIGFRSPGFSATTATPWFFDKLVEAGYRYDSSVFPAPRAHGGLPTGGFFPYRQTVREGSIIEFPITVVRIVNKPLCMFGGGYLRLFPYPLVRYMSHKVLREGRPVIYYVHPREIDPHQPRLSMSLTRKFKTYVNLNGLENKVRRLTQDFKLTSFERFMNTFPVEESEPVCKNVM
jgi:polysaccharide deacetylase family protein (PEP-CTERM system associated)